MFNGATGTMGLTDLRPERNRKKQQRDEEGQDDKDEECVCVCERKRERPDYVLAQMCHDC